ncbi:VOC family protein [Fibrella forsythiae]|uniref:VOC family protein n=1 Tax=Fibrella forsythiae TaxID=2817061 RepID=A0ABS3JMQ2_9BACT|nr:VOC family protein [Fibrella forsythiae]MBO0950743.1 VOC family protein [Fibrella forsythiae]
MKRVTGIGGIFFKADQPDQLRDWYGEHLGFNTDQYGASFEWRRADAPDQKSVTQWSAFPADSPYFAPSEKTFMLNFQVENLVELLDLLRQEGVTVLGEIEEHDYGKFGWIMDPEGNKIELWEPSASN